MNKVYVLALFPICTSLISLSFVDNRYFAIGGTVLPK